MELKGEEEMGRRRFSGGSEGGMTVLRFGSSRAAGGAAVPMEARGGSRWKPEVGADGETKMG
jgi:hypothetical protein